MSVLSIQSNFDLHRWNEAVELQKEVCMRLGTDYYPLDPLQNVGLSDNLDESPLHGLRYPSDRYSGWFVWSGDFQQRDDFFRPHHAVHLLDTAPLLVKYLGLGPGYRFLIDRQGYEDVWLDESLLLSDGG